MLVAFDVVKYERGAVAGRQLRERAVERHAVNQLRSVRPARDARLRGPRLEAFERLFPSRLALAETHQDLIDGETVEPSIELTLAAETARLAVEHDEDFLCDVFGLGDVLRHAEAEAI